MTSTRLPVPSSSTWNKATEKSSRADAGGAWAAPHVEVKATWPRTMPNSFDYQERVVAFIDVLGFAELVKANDTDLTARTKLGRLIDTNIFF
jgi:hypothetical protein